LNLCLDSRFLTTNIVFPPSSHEVSGVYQNGPRIFSSASFPSRKLIWGLGPYAFIHEELDSNLVRTKDCSEIYVCIIFSVSTSEFCNNNLKQVTIVSFQILTCRSR